MALSRGVWIEQSVWERKNTMQTATDETLQHEAIQLAEAWQNRADALYKNEEKQYQKQIKHLLTHP
jgi:hypothetical protein